MNGVASLLGQEEIIVYSLSVHFHFTFTFISLSLLFHSHFHLEKRLYNGIPSLAESDQIRDVYDDVDQGGHAQLASNNCTDKK